MEENKLEVFSGEDTAVVKTDEISSIVNENQKNVPLDRERVDKIKQGINLDKIELYGSDAQQTANGLSEEVLKNVKNDQLGAIGVSLKEAALRIKKLDDKDKPLSKGIFGFLREKKNEKMIEIQSVTKELSDIENTLEKNIEVLYKDTEMFNKLYELNEKKYIELEHYIKAGEEYMREVEIGKLQEMEINANVSGDPLAVQEVKDLKSKLNRLDKKLTDLRVTKHLALQTAPQIRLIQGNNVLLVQNIQTTINTILPVVRSNITITVGLNRQKEILELNNAVSDLANNVLLENSRLMKDNVLGTIEQAEKPIVSIETLREVNKNILSTIDSAIKIQNEGMQKRKAINEELVQLEQELTGKLREYKN